MLEYLCFIPVSIIMIIVGKNTGYCTQRFRFYFFHLIAYAGGYYSTDIECDSMLNFWLILIGSYQVVFAPCRLRDYLLGSARGDSCLGKRGGNCMNMFRSFISLCLTCYVLISTLVVTGGHPTCEAPCCYVSFYLMIGLSAANVLFNILCCFNICCMCFKKTNNSINS